MTDMVRTLNKDGMSRYLSWLETTKNGAKEAPPNEILLDPQYSEILNSSVYVDRQPEDSSFNSRLDFGLYLKDKLSAFDKTEISRLAGVWNWLSLYYIDQLAPPAADNSRTILNLEVYFLEAGFNFRTYYRHAVRTPWLAAYEHGLESRVLLVPAGKPRSGVGILAHLGEIFEQLASRQWTFGNTTIIQCAGRLYLDPETNKPGKGTGGSGAGSPRRLAEVINQLELTYDLNACSVEQFMGLLPKDFDRWKSNKKEEKKSNTLGKILGFK